jgi:hypothetical protein
MVGYTGWLLEPRGSGAFFCALTQLRGFFTT